MSDSVSISLPVHRRGRRWNREEICAAYGVPMSKVTSENVNLANAYVGERQYAADTILPRTTRIEEKLNENSFIQRYGQNMFVAFDNPVPEDKEFELKERESDLKNSVKSINEVRKQRGLEEVEWGNIPLVTAGVAPLGSQQQGQQGGANPNAMSDMGDDSSYEQWGMRLEELTQKLEERFVQKWKQQRLIESPPKPVRIIPMRRRALKGGQS